MTKSMPRVPVQPLDAAIFSARAIIPAHAGWSKGVTDPENPNADVPFSRRICSFTAIARALSPFATQQTLAGIPSATCWRI